MWNIEGTASCGKYIYAIVHSHPKAIDHGYVLLHRVLMENKIGRMLLSNEVVHHKNGNKRDNRIQNLQLMTVAEHNLTHAQQNRKPMVTLSCPQCKGMFERPRKRTHLSRRNQERTFCSRSCAGTWNRERQLAASGEIISIKAIDLMCPICGKSKSRYAKTCRRCRVDYGRQKSFPKQDVIKSELQTSSIAAVCKKHSISLNTFRRIYLSS
jgi:predicted RNA-binding Zn-ribbon protein involved in translation (DUF1610 family)